MARDGAPLQNYVLKDGVLRCVAQAPAAFYKEDPARVLALFTAAAAKNCTVDVDTYEAALSAAPGIQRLPTAAVREAVQNILLSDVPQALGPLLSGGALGPYGLAGTGECLHVLKEVPCTMETRWWVLLRLCRAQYALVCEKFGFSQGFAGTLAGLDRLAAVPHLPQSVSELKQLLSRLPEFDYEAAVKTLLRQDMRWAGQLALYDSLCESREPYRLRHLAVTPAELAAQGITGARAAWVLHGMLDAVIKAPSLNTQPALMALAGVLAGQYR